MSLDICKNFYGMFLLKDKSYKEATKSSFGKAALIFLIAALGTAIGSLWTSVSVGTFFSDWIGGFIGLIIAYFIGVGILFLFAKLFGGKGDYMPYYNGFSYLSLFMLLQIIPGQIGKILVFLGGLWAIVMSIFLTRSHFKLSTGKAVATVLIPYVIIAVLALILLMTVFASLLGGAAGGLAGLPFTY